MLSLFFEDGQAINPTLTDGCAYMLFFSGGVCLAKPKLLNSSDEAAESKKRRSRMSRSHAFRPFLLATSPPPSSNPGSPQMYIEASFELIGRTPARLVFFSELRKI